MSATRIGGDTKSTTVAALNVVWPAGVQAGHIAIVFSGHSNASTTTTPTGFTLLKTSQTNAAWGECYVKVCTGSETGNLAVNVSTASKHEASLEVWGGILTPTASDVSVGTGTSDAATTSAVPAVTTTSAPAFWITHTVQANSTPPTSYTAPTGTTLAGQGINSGSGSKSGATAYSNASETDASVGSGTWTRVGGSGNIDWSNFTVALTESVSRVTKTGTLSFNTLNRPSAKASTLSYDVLNRGTKTGTVSANTAARGTITGSVTFDVAGSTGRVQKNSTLSYDTIGRVSTARTLSYDTQAAVTRVTKTGTLSYNTLTRPTTKTATLSFNLASVISEATGPFWIGHRGTDPGPEETLFAYATLKARGSGFWHEGDGQLTSNGTPVASHDDTIDRMYSSGPVATGNITAMTDAQVSATFLRYNTGFTGTEKPMMFLSQWVSAYNGDGTTIGLWEVKTGTPVASMTAAFSTMKGQVVLNCNSLSDAQAAVAAGFTTCYQTDTPTFSQFTANGIKFLSINYTAMTSTIAANAEAAGVKVLMYTVNSTTNRDSMLALFSDPANTGFISNKPQTISTGSRVSKTGTLSYATLNRPAAKTGTLSYNTLTRPATKTGTVSYNTLARVVDTGTVSYNVAQRGSRTGSVTFDVAGAGSRIQKNSTLSYNLASRGSRTRTLSYNVAQRGSKTGTVSYAALLRGQRTGTISFNTLTDSALDGLELWFSDGAMMKRIGQIVHT